MVKVSGGARTTTGVGLHMAYVGRDGDLGVEMDSGVRVDGKGFEKQVISDWDLDLEAQDLRSPSPDLRRKPVKLVHNLIFSMPPGTSPGAVLKAVKKLAANEWALKHRYAMVLHTDERHPHVHVVLKAMGERGERLNIRKATLRSWRAQFAENLRELGVTANATERAVRGESRSRKRDAIYRANRRGDSTHMEQRHAQVGGELRTGGLKMEKGRGVLLRTRAEVREGWRRLGVMLEAQGDRELSDAVRAFESRMPVPRTERELLAKEMLERSRARAAKEMDPPTR
ncbi:MAG: relaxase/mobilization nuclease domain-containing protein [Proteobacteria bacterium]|nr:relaxase/mobilization nuclease domain-containing protein [Pseudomonadota bacterium]